MSAERLFHLAPPDAPASARDSGLWSPPSLASEGFVHLSFARQLPGTLAIHFADVRELLLLEVDGAAVEDALRIEASRDGELFPHVYRALACEELLRSWPLVRDARGFALPALADTPAGDVPGGHPLP